MKNKDNQSKQSDEKSLEAPSKKEKDNILILSFMDKKVEELSRPYELSNEHVNIDYKSIIRDHHEIQQIIDGKYPNMDKYNKIIFDVHGITTGKRKTLTEKHYISVDPSKVKFPFEYYGTETNQVNTLDVIKLFQEKFPNIDEIIMSSCHSGSLRAIANQIEPKCTITALSAAKHPARTAELWRRHKWRIENYDKYKNPLISAGAASKIFPSTTTILVPRNNNYVEVKITAPKHPEDIKNIKAFLSGEKYGIFSKQDKTKQYQRYNVQLRSERSKESEEVCNMVMQGKKGVELTDEILKLYINDAVLMYRVFAEDENNSIYTDRKNLFLDVHMNLYNQTILADEETFNIFYIQLCEDIKSQNYKKLTEDYKFVMNVCPSYKYYKKIFETIMQKYHKNDTFKIKVLFDAALYAAKYGQYTEAKQYYNIILTEFSEFKVHENVFKAIVKHPEVMTNNFEWFNKCLKEFESKNEKSVRFNWLSFFNSLIKNKSPIEQICEVVINMSKMGSATDIADRIYEVSTSVSDKEFEVFYKTIEKEILKNLPISKLDSFHYEICETLNEIDKPDLAQSFSTKVKELQEQIESKTHVEKEAQKKQNKNDHNSLNGPG